MKRIIVLLSVLFLFAGCAAAPRKSEYGTDKKIDALNNDIVTITMQGGLVDATPRGPVSYPVQFNPYVVRSLKGKILSTGIYGTYYVGTEIKQGNIAVGSPAIFSLDNGSDTIEIKADKVDFAYIETLVMGGIETTKKTMGWFSITPEELKRIAYANTLTVRVIGVSGYLDFPREKRQLTESFLPNIKHFYDTEIHPFLQ